MWQKEGKEIGFSKSDDVGAAHKHIAFIYRNLATPKYTKDGDKGVVIFLGILFKLKIRFGFFLVLNKFSFNLQELIV